MDNKENFKEEKIPGEFLDDPEMIDEFMVLYGNRLQQKLSKVKQLKAELTKEELEIATMKERVLILEKYKIFLESKGFHIAKQTIDAHAAEINKAQTERITEDEICRKPCFVAGYQMTCMQYNAHSGPCGLISS